MESLEMYNMTQYYKGTFNLARTLDNTPTVTVNVTGEIYEQFTSSTHQRLIYLKNNPNYVDYLTTEIYKTK